MIKQLIALSLVVLLGSHFFGNSIMNALAGETEGRRPRSIIPALRYKKGTAYGALPERIWKTAE